MHPRILCVIVLVFTLFSQPIRSDDEPDLGVGHFSLSNVMWIYGGVDFGFAILNSSVAGEGKKTGTQFQLGVSTKLFSIGETDFDLGLGWYRSSVSDDTRSVRVKTDAFFSQLAIRYRIIPRFQVGATLQFLFGSDLSFSEGSGSQSFALLVGPSTFYEVPFVSQRLRIGAQFLTDVNVSSRQLYAVQGFVHIGFPIRFSSSKGSDPKRKNAPLVEAGENTVRVILDSASLPFRTGSTKLSESGRNFIRKLSEYLSTQPALWERLRIEGHTDRSGSQEKNKQLSLIRAEAVQKMFVFYGVSFKKTEIVGMGSKKPRAKTAKKNRRIELHFSGVTNPSKLTEAISRFSQSTLEQ